MNGELSSWNQQPTRARMNVRTAQQLQSIREVHNVRRIYRARLSAHRIRARATEAQAGGAAIDRRESAAAAAPTPIAGSHLRPDYSAARYASHGQAVTGRTELMTVCTSRESRHRANAGRITGQRSGIPDAAAHRQTRGACQVTLAWTTTCSTSSRTRSRGRRRSVGCGVGDSGVRDSVEEFNWTHHPRAGDVVPNVQQVPVA